MLVRGYHQRMSGDTWEARMAARASEREQKRRETAAAPVEELLVQHDWLNGWPRTGRTQVLIGTEVHCLACGRCVGITCVAFPPDWEPPGPKPEWPFSEADCPVDDCRDLTPVFHGQFG